MSGEAMQMRPQLAKLASLHKVAPASFAPLPLAAPVDYPVTVTGLASTVDLDQTRMKFRGWCFPILPWQKDYPPLLVKHDPSRVAGVIDHLDYDAHGNLRSGH